jgi:hypothetical protein
MARLSTRLGLATFVVLSGGALPARGAGMPASANGAHAAGAAAPAPAPAPRATALPSAPRGAVPLDASLEPVPPSADSISTVFRDMVVVQRKAKEKAKKILFYPYGSFDFSDGPTTMYGLNLDLGYAFSDEFELYAGYVPAFVANQRQIVSEVSSLTLQNGARAQLTYATPQAQYGLELLWAPAYGKDSWGPRHIVRSDTFFKLSAGMVQYSGASGGRYGLSLGKTFFLSRLLNFRASAGTSYVQAVVNGSATYYLLGILEFGIVWYL